MVLHYNVFFNEILFLSLSQAGAIFIQNGQKVFKTSAKSAGEQNVQTTRRCQPEHDGCVLHLRIRSMDVAHSGKAICVAPQIHNESTVQAATAQIRNRISFGKHLIAPPRTQPKKATHNPHMAAPPMPL